MGLTLEFSTRKRFNFLVLIIDERALTVDLDVTPGDAHLVLADAVVGPLVLLVPAHPHTHTVNNSTETASNWHFYHMSQREFFSVFTLSTTLVSKFTKKLCYRKIWNSNFIRKKMRKKERLCIFYSHIHCSWLGGIVTLFGKIHKYTEGES
jgi:hypothetical protein